MEDSVSNEELKTLTKDVRVTVSPEMWKTFEVWMATRGCANRSEGFRVMMQELVDQNEGGNSKE